MKFPAQTSKVGNEFSRLNVRWTVFKCHDVIGKISFSILEYKYIPNCYPPNRQGRRSERIIDAFFFISSVLVQYGEEQHNALKVTSSTDTLFIQFQQNSIIV